MRPSAQSLLAAWELGVGQHPVDRALTLLLAAEGRSSRQELAALPLGERDRRLLALHRAAFGNRLSCRVDCEACGEPLEFSLDADALEVPSADPGENELSWAEYRIRFRPLDSHDLAAAAACDTVKRGQATLLERCVVSAWRSEVRIEPGALPEAVVAALSQALAERDPQADILLDLSCPGCSRAWQASLDLVPFLWSKVSAQAQRLLREVHALASAYGWTEQDILDLPPARRQAYLALVHE